MADEEYAYLEPDFEPSTLTVPRLRSILVAHNVSYPSSAKKPDLVALFNDNVAPQARKIRNAQSRTKRSTRGIVDVPSGQASTVGDDEDEEDELQPLETPSTARRTSRRTTRAQTEEVIVATPRTSRSTRQSTAPASTQKSVKHANPDGAADQEPEPKRLAPRRTRQSVSPAVKSEEDEPRYREGPESPFSRDNPFQSGSPPAELREKSSDRRRTTMGHPVDTDRRAREARRRTDTYKAVKQDDGVIVPTSSTFEMPVSRLKTQQIEAQDDLPTGEEFTPEEQLDLVRDGKADGTVAVRPRKTKQAKSGIAKAAPWSILVALLGGLATVWRQEKLNVGYCGVGEPSTSLAGVDIPEWASTLRPQCEPCPQHAYCYPDLQTVCEPDFVLTPHPLSVNGLIPYPPTCEPDSEKVRKIKQVADFAIDTELRERNAKYECGEIKAPEIAEDELKEVISSKKSRRMTDDEFNALWESALGEIVGRDEVVSKVDGKDPNRRLLRSTSVARIGLACAVKRSIRSTIRQHLPKLVALLFISLSAVYGRHALVVRRSTSSRAKELAGVALDKLATQASLHATDAVAYPEPWVSMVALRDDVLRDEFSARARTSLWEVVKGLVEGNANVRTMVREGRTGDVSRVWEWIGAVQRIESPEAGRRNSGRFSLGGQGRIAGGTGRLVEARSEDESEGTPRQGTPRELTEVSRWTEGSPYY